MKRIVVDSNLGESGMATLGPEQTNYLRNVLRLRPGSRIRVVDGAGRQWTGEIRCYSPRGRSTNLAYFNPESSGKEAVVPQVTILLSLLKARKMELAIRQLSELGVKRIVPVAARRSVARVTEAKAGERAQRWMKIASEALRQSGREHLPSIESPLPVEEALVSWKSDGINIAAWEEEKEVTVSACLQSRSYSNSTILVGPEGGLAEDEAVLASESGYTLVSLGPNILRAETAAVALAAIVLHYQM